MSLRSFRSFIVVATTLACASCGSGGYGSSSNPSSPSSTPTTPSNAITINVVSRNGTQSFSPNPAAAGGQMVVFKNTDSIVHRVVLNDGSVDTGDIAPGATSAAVLMPAGGTNYHCALHPDMIGAVDTASGADPPACTGAYCDGSGASY
ncbi:MAG TPA: hypothetical protein VG871_21585 [Vicinamibacterales bacterium]|nr:hypothetical protein [Vicinamibacterales bacterium]